METENKNKYIKKFILYGLLINLFIYLAFLSNGLFYMIYLLGFAYMPLMLLQALNLNFGYLGGDYINVLIATSIFVAPFAAILGWLYEKFKSKLLIIIIIIISLYFFYDLNVMSN